MVRQKRPRWRRGAAANAGLANQGQAIVELLVVCLISAVMALGVFFTMVRASRYEQNVRREAFARTQLALYLERIERGFSLASSTSGGDGGEIESLLQDEDAAFSVFFPKETGGVSFETNRAFRVSGASLSWTGNALFGKVDMAGDADGMKKRMDAEQAPFATAAPFSMDRGEMRDVVFKGFFVTNMTPRLLEVKLEADVLQVLSDGTRRFKPICASRIVRMWNR